MSTHEDVEPVADQTPSVCCARRDALKVAGIGAVGVVGLSACGSATDAGAKASSAVSGAVASATSAAGKAAGEAVAKAGIPVGGGKVIEALKVVITQPTSGDFKAFSAVCPHQGCLVTDVKDNKIVCPCHGSQFDASTGAVTAGPATTGLTPKSVTVSGDGISVN